MTTSSKPSERKWRRRWRGSWNGATRGRPCLRRPSAQRASDRGGSAESRDGRDHCLRCWTPQGDEALPAWLVPPTAWRVLVDLALVSKARVLALVGRHLCRRARLPGLFALDLFRAVERLTVHARRIAIFG